LGQKNVFVDVKNWKNTMLMMNHDDDDKWGRNVPIMDPSFQMGQSGMECMECM